MSIIDVTLTLSPSSSEAERGFSQLKLTKTSLRTKMNGQALNETLRIKLLSAPVCEFHPLPAISLWNGPSQRAWRPNFKTAASHSSAFELATPASHDHILQ